MARPKLVVVTPEKSDQSRASRDEKKYRIEVSKKRLVFYVSCFAAALCWMFVLGVLAGRGIALVSSEDISVRAGLMRFMGLGKQADQPAPKAAETWEEPRKILDSLNYYEDLTRKEAGAGITAPAPSPRPSEKTPAVKPEKTARATPAPEPEPEKPARPAPSDSVAPGEHFTLLVSSLQNPANAQRLMTQLKAKGYSPRLETLDLNGAWNRVLVGSFQAREAALKFAAEFNRKEKMEGLVIRESN